MSLRRKRMKTRPAAAHVASGAACLVGPGEMAALMQTLDWAGTALGVVEGWPLSLCTGVRILLGSHQGMWLVWGPQQVFLYNDAFLRTFPMADRHSGALGRPAAQAWPDVWPAIQERIAPVLATGRAGFDDELMLLVQRGGQLEETYHTMSYCPLPDDDGHIDGLLCIEVDVTARVLQERRMHCLRETAAIVASPQSGQAMAAALQRVLGRCARDLPFTLTYLYDDRGDARLVCTSGIGRDDPGAPKSIAAGDAVPWPAAAVRHGGTLVLRDLAGLGELPRGAWDRPPAAAAVAAHTPFSQQHAAGFMAVGLNLYRPWDASYQEFVQQLADRVCAGLAVACSHAIASPSPQPAPAPRRSGQRLVPVIQLAESACQVAGPGDAGGGDRLLKPATAQESRACGAARLELARMQREAAAREQALSASSEEAEGMKRLHDFSSRLLTINGLQPLLEEVLDATIALHGADFGLVQQLDPASGALLIVAQRKLPEAFVSHFARVYDETAPCGRAMVRRERVIVEDVLADPLFAPHLGLAEATGFRAVQSTPLVSRKGELLGVISTLFRQPRRFSVTVLRFTDLYARHAADLVERNRAEEALRASEERFRRYFDLGLIGMGLTSLSKGCIEVNDELCRILGYPRDELMRLQWPQLTHPDDLAADVAQFDRVMAGEQDGYVLEKRFIRKDGEAVWCTMAAQCVRAADGSVEFLVTLVQDMTERLQADEALRRAREQLTHVFRVAAMGELVATIAHEINQPLAAIVANGLATARWLAAQPPNHGEAVAAVQRIEADAHRASNAVAGIRRFLRRSEAQWAPVDLHATVCEVARMLEPEARARHVRLQVEPRRSAAILVPGDTVQLQQVILNLAMNGFDAMATVPEAQRCLRLAVEAEGRHAVRVDVCDAGHGVPPLARERIFDAFHTTKHAGMGLGLAISRSIVEAHGGRLWCTPNTGGGETFSFVLPA